MSTTQKPTAPRWRYPLPAYRLVLTALCYTQEKLGRKVRPGTDDAAAHITGQELCHGLRQYALENFGLLARTVLGQWGIHNTLDVGRIVFELIERGEMRKTDRDQLSDFADVYDFQEAFDRDYHIDISQVFGRGRAALPR